MAMHEGSAFLHMTGVAGVISAALDQRFRIVVVHVVAGGASHLTFEHWMMRRTIDLRTLFLVAREADFGLGLLVSRLVVAVMHRVAGGTGYAAIGVGAGLPVDVLATLVAAYAGATLLFVRILRPFYKGDIHLRRLVLALIVRMRVALAMAAGAGRRSAVCSGAVT